MYLLTWNEEKQSVVAGIGGVVTSAEATVLLEEVEALLKTQSSVGQVELDATKVSRFQDGAFEILEKMRFLASSNGAKLNLITNRPATEEAISPNVRAILEGQTEELYHYKIA